MTANYSDTVCAPATSVGTGAVSVIRISGPESLRIVDKVVRFRSGSASESRGYVLKYGEIPGVDEVVAGIYRAPHSYTGEDSVELCCHASAYIAGRILELLCDSGCRLAEAGEFTRRAFVNGKMDLAQAEAVADVIAKIRAELLELTSLMELELDFSEEDLEFADRGRLETLLNDAIGRCTTLADSFRLGNAIRNGVPVAIVGAPNSGKSTLLNALLHDERAIVSDVPGTTRDTVEETCVIGGVLFRFIDTAGIRETSDKVERLGIERSFSKAAGAEVVLGVVDAGGGDDVSSVLGQIRKLVGMVDLSKQKLVLLMNKCDKISENSDAASGSSDANVRAAGEGLLGGHFCNESGGIGPDNKNVIKINNFVKSLVSENNAPEVLWISAKRGFGLDKLRELCANCSHRWSGRPPRTACSSPTHATPPHCVTPPHRSALSAPAWAPSPQTSWPKTSAPPSPLSAQSRALSEPKKCSERYFRSSASGSERTSLNLVENLKFVFQTS